MDSHFAQFRIRDWQPQDRESVAALISKVLAEFGLGLQPEEADRDALEVERCYLHKGGEFWVVELTDQPGQLVGTAAYYPSHRGTQAAEVRKMYLLPEVRGQGLGTYLLTQLEQQIRAQGFTEIWLETLSSMQAATQLYNRFRYQQSREVETKRCDRAYLKYLGKKSE
jgi:putative acetyltransferase